MGDVLRALAASLAFHGLLALGIAAWIGGAPDMELASLDLSSVEISFAEQDAESAPPVPMPPSPPTAEAPRPEAAEPPEFAPDEPVLSPPDPAAARLPEPAPDEPPKLEETEHDVAEPSPESAEPVPAAPSQARIDAPARPTRTIRPDYPKGARQRGEQGDVLLELMISARGVVEDVRVVRSSGYPELDAAAEKAVRRAPFAPAKSGDGPIASSARITITFRLK